MTLEYVLKQHGIVPQEDAVVDTSVQFNMMAGAFTGGQGDYVTLFEPTATEVERAGHGYILCSIGEESGEIPYTAYFASQSYMTAHPEVIQGFANAIARAQQWIVDHTDREVAEAIIDQFPDTDLDTLEAVTARHRQIDAWNAGPMMARSALDRGRRAGEGPVGGLRQAGGQQLCPEGHGSAISKKESPCGLSFLRSYQLRAEMTSAYLSMSDAPFQVIKPPVHPASRRARTSSASSAAP